MNRLSVILSLLSVDIQILQLMVWFIIYGYLRCTDAYLFIHFMRRGQSFIHHGECIFIIFGFKFQMVLKTLKRHNLKCCNVMRSFLTNIFVVKFYVIQFSKTVR